MKKLLYSGATGPLITNICRTKETENESSSQVGDYILREGAIYKKYTYFKKNKVKRNIINQMILLWWQDQK